VSDSPLSTLIAENAPADKEEHLLSLTAFIVTIFWYQLISALNTFTNSNAIYLCLALGPILVSGFEKKVADALV
jgi:hypothetical protein